MKSKPVIKLNPCKYRSCSQEDEGDYCCKGLANNDGDLEPCDYCNTDFESQLQEFYGEEQSNEK